jgi:gluconate 5-dehydrogenase
MLDCFDLTGKIAIVTGASKGLGFVFAKALAKAGASLFLIARNEEQLKTNAQVIIAYGVPCDWAVADITQESEVAAAFSKCIDIYGRIDIFVNNAACGRNNIPPEQTSLDDWNFVIDTNLTGSFICAREAGRQMIRQKGGKIINLASMSGLIINKGVHGGSYEISKHGVIGLTRALAVEWARHNINVNALAPGYFMTQLNRDFFDDNPEVLDQFIELTPAGRIGEPDELEGAIVFLASKASDFMYGSVLVIDGGYTCW